MREPDPADLTLAYAYDFAGNRIAKTNYTGPTPTQTGFLIDNNNLTGYSQTFYEYDGDTTQINRLYEYGDDLTAQLKLTDGLPDARQYILYDGLGTTRALTDTTATIQEDYNYTPFGGGVEHPTNPATSHLFTGEAYDNDLAQYYLRARMYDPAIGRFTSFDPFEDDANRLHKYAYCASDPINRFDASGGMTLGEVMNVAAINTMISGIVAIGAGVGVKLSKPGSVSNDFFSLLFVASMITFFVASSVFFAALAIGSGPIAGGGALAVAGGGGGLATTVTVSGAFAKVLAAGGLVYLFKKWIILLAEAVGTPDNLSFRSGGSNPKHGGDDLPPIVVPLTMI